METGSSILNYVGDASLGLAENTAIPVAAERPDLDAVNQAAQNLRLYDHQNNLTIYNQKIADRDKMLGLLSQGKVNSGKILPQDQKYYDQLEKEQTEAWKKIGGLQDKEGMANYLTKTQQLNDLVTKLQHRYIQIGELEKEKAKLTLPKDIEAYNAHISKMVNQSIDELVTPFQKAFSGDFDKMRNSIRGSQMLTKGVGGQLPPQGQETVTVTDKDGKQTVKTVIAPPKQVGVVTSKKGAASSNMVNPSGGGIQSLSIWQETPEKYYDYPTMQKRAEQLYLDDKDEAENQRQWFKSFHEATPFIQKDIVEKYNNRIKEYSAQRGFEPDANGNYPDEIKYRVINGKYILDEQPWTFAAKDALASIEGDYVEKGVRTINKDIAELVIKDKVANADIFAKKMNALTNRDKAKGYLANVYSQIKAREGEPEEQKKLLDDIFTRNAVAQPKFLSITGNALSNFKNENSLPLYRFDAKAGAILVKPFGGEPIVENKTIIGYKGGEYKQRYTYEGRDVDFNTLSKLYVDTRKIFGKTAKEFSMEDFLKSAIEDGNSGLGLKIIGENGETDKQTNTDALRLINNKASKKGQEGVFEMPMEPQD